MWNGKLRVLMICALAVVAVGGRGYAAETIVKAKAPIKGEGRFYKATDQHLVFVGYFQGKLTVEPSGDLNGADLVCPGLIEVNRTTRTQEGAGRCIITQGNDFLYARWTCTGQAMEGCAGPFTVIGGTGKFSQATGEGRFAVLSDVMEVVTTVPERDVTGAFTGQAAWTALKYTTP